MIHGRCADLLATAVFAGVLGYRAIVTCATFDHPDTPLALNALTA